MYTVAKHADVCVGDACSRPSRGSACAHAPVITGDAADTPAMRGPLLTGICRAPSLPCHGPWGIIKPGQHQGHPLPWGPWAHSNRVRGKVSHMTFAFGFGFWRFRGVQTCRWPYTGVRSWGPNPTQLPAQCRCSRPPPLVCFAASPPAGRVLQAWQPRPAQLASPVLLLPLRW